MTQKYFLRSISSSITCIFFCILNVVITRKKNFLSLQGIYLRDIPSLHVTFNYINHERRKYQEKGAKINLLFLHFTFDILIQITEAYILY